ncbi:MAG: Ppx/GppA phosphatase family protein [Thermodesulfobacteriota bacterium]
MKYATTSLHRVGAIDIGTNTILLLIAEWEGRKIKSLLEKETIVRLGEGVHQHGYLSREAMERGFKTLTEYLKDCHRLGVERIFAVGTSALREAKNAKEFIQEAKKRLHLSIEILSGEEEAYLSYLSIYKDLNEEERKILVVDIGGGSTEFILGLGENILQLISLPMGSVRFTEEFLHSDPVKPKELEKMEKKMDEELIELTSFHKPHRMVAVGGTATTLAQVEMALEEFHPEKIHHFELTQKALKRQILLYQSKTSTERRGILGLPPSRADVILAGAAILFKAMEKMNCPKVMISCHGVRYGLIYKKLSS